MRSTTSRRCWKINESRWKSGEDFWKSNECRTKVEGNVFDTAGCNLKTDDGQHAASNEIHKKWPAHQQRQVQKDIDNEDSTTTSCYVVPVMQCGVQTNKTAVLPENDLGEDQACGSTDATCRLNEGKCETRNDHEKFSEGCDTPYLDKEKEVTFISHNDSFSN